MKIRIKKPKKEVVFKTIIIIASIGLLMTTFLPILISLR
jgi:hypothetical protein